MAWVRTDDAAYMHPKFLALDDDAAVALWWRALGHCNHHKTGGFVAEGALRMLSLAPRPPALAAKLVKVGLWEATEGGYQFHDYAHYQGTREQVEEAKRAPSPARQEAGRRSGQRSGEVRRAKSQRSNGEPKRSNGEATANQNEATATSARSNGEATAETTRGSRASDPDPDPLPGSPSRSDLNPTHSAGAGERFDPGKPSAPKPAPQPAPEPDQRDIDQPERAAMLAALQASPMFCAVADTAPLGAAAALGGLADYVTGLRVSSGKPVEQYLAAIADAVRDLAADAVGSGLPTWTIASKQVAKYCFNARPPRPTPAPRGRTAPTVHAPSPFTTDYARRQGIRPDDALTEDDLPPEARS